MTPPGEKQQNSPANGVITALDDFMQRFLERYRQNAGSTSAQQPLPLIDYDPQWPSLCYQLSAEQQPGTAVPWKPVRQQQATSLFDGLAAALETAIHPDIESYYSRYWSDPVQASYQGDLLNLLFVWNEADYDRLRGNLIGHALAQRRNNLPLTLFFACTEPEDYILSIENHSGAVVLEQPGQAPIRTIADNLTVFLQQLTPVIA